MEVPQEPLKFEQFLLFKNFQKLFFMQHFKFSRDECGKLVTKSNTVFYATFVLHFCFFLGTFVAIFKSDNFGTDGNVPVLSIASFFTVRGAFMYAKRHEILKLLNILDSDFPKDLAAQKVAQLPQMYKQTLKRHKYADFALSLAVFGFCTMPPVVYMFTRDTNGPIRLEQQLLGSWIPYGLRDSHRAYPLTWFYDVLASVSGTAYFASSDTLFIAMHDYIVMQLNSLSRQMDALDWTTSDDSKLYDKLCQLIRRHQYLNTLCDQFNELFNIIILITDLMGSATICFHLYLLSETSELLMIIRYVGPMTLLSAFLFEICLRGAQLEEASSQLNSTLYNQKWYVCGRKNRKLVLLWLKYTQCTKRLNALGLMELNMKHFTDIMNLSYRLFTFLKTSQDA